MKIFHFVAVNQLLGILFCVGSLFFCFDANAQSGRGRAVYLEILGPSAAYSANFDFRFENKNDGFGMRLGIGYHDVSDESFLAIPVLANWITGSGRHFFEVGIGASYISIQDDFGSSPFDPDNVFLFDYGSRVFGMLTAGYRLQPVNRGFSFRVGISPVFGHGNFIPYWPYASFGYKF